MKPKDAIKMGVAMLHKPETYPKKEVLPDDGLCSCLYHPVKQHKDQKKQATNVTGSKYMYRLD